MNINNINIIYDGRIHRFRVDGDKAGSKNGWYLANHNGWVIYSSWKEGGARYYINKDGTTLNEQDLKQFRKQLAIDRHIQIIKQDDEAKKLQPILDSSIMASHDYLIRKGFHSMRGHILSEALIVPIYDISRNHQKLISLQYIYRDGTKRFAKGCKTKGGMHMIVTSSVTDTKTIYLCEGFATGLTIAKATNVLVATCFYAINLLYAAEILSRRFSEYKIIICADNDLNTAGNPGVTEAKKAAQKFHSGLILPDLSKCSDQATDFNDIMVECSLEEVRKQLLEEPKYF